MSPCTARVLTYLKNKANKGVADVRQRDIMAGADVSYGSTHAALRWLESVGVVETLRSTIDKREVGYRLKRIGS